MGNWAAVQRSTEHLLCTNAAVATTVQGGKGSVGAGACRRFLGSPQPCLSTGPGITGTGHRAWGGSAPGVTLNQDEWGLVDQPSVLRRRF